MTKADVELVEGELEDLCRSILDEWNIRMIQSPLSMATCNTLGKPIRRKDDETTDNYNARLKDGLNKLLQELPEHIQERYEVADLLDSYITYMEVFIELEDEVQFHEIYCEWYKKHIKNENTEDNNRIFADFFECVQIRSSSEAFCETVGSVMNNHCGKGRYLRPVNFNKEIFLEVNLGPTYQSEKLVKEVYELRKKEYLFKENSLGQVKGIVKKWLVDDRYGSALRTYRRNQSKKSRFPSVFWE